MKSILQRILDIRLISRHLGVELEGIYLDQVDVTELREATCYVDLDLSKGYFTNGDRIVGSIKVFGQAIRSY
jgi:hypothetical protein